MESSLFFFLIHSFIFCFFETEFQDKVSLCKQPWLSCLGTRFVDQAGLELRFACFCLLSAGIKGMSHCCPVGIIFKFHLGKKFINKLQLMQHACGK